MKCPPKSGERVDHRITITLQSWRLIFYTATLSIYLDFFPLLETKRVNSLVEQPSHRTLRKEPRLSDYFCGMIPTKKTRGVERAREREMLERCYRGLCFLTQMFLLLLCRYRIKKDSFESSNPKVSHPHS